MDRFVRKRREPGLPEVTPPGAASAGTGPHAAVNTSDNSFVSERAVRACSSTEPGVPEGHPEPAAGLSSESSCALEPAERTAGGPSESLQLPDVEVSSCSSTDGEQSPDFSCCDEASRTWLRSEQAS